MAESCLQRCSELDVAVRMLRQYGLGHNPRIHSLADEAVIRTAYDRLGKPAEAITGKETGGMVGRRPTETESLVGPSRALLEAVGVDPDRVSEGEPVRATKCDGTVNIGKPACRACLGQPFGEPLSEAAERMVAESQI